MRTEDFGGFSTRTCSIDLRFSTPDQLDHFIKAWGSKGRPDLEAHPRERWMEMISVGTTLEHELRHYHDFVLNYASLHNYWLRVQAMMNAAPLLGQMLQDPGIEYLTFPMMDWAKASLDTRCRYIEDALGIPDAHVRTWAPPVLEGPKPASTLEQGVLPGTVETRRHLLFVLRDQLDVISDVRGGLRDSGFPFALTPRFVSELSSLLVQCASVQQTYGFAELDFFMNRLASDDALYPRFFTGMVQLFSGLSPTASGSVNYLDTTAIDWRALGVGVTWCFGGSAANPELLRPVVRMARLIQAAEQDLSAVFPHDLGFEDLADHLDRYFGVETAAASAERNSQALQGFLHRGAEKIRTAGDAARPLRPLIEIFEGLLIERERVVSRILQDPAEYTDVGRYVRALPHWPQCQVTLDFSPAGIAVSKDLLRKLGDAPVFADKRGGEGEPSGNMVDEVSYPSFLPGGTSFPWKVAMEQADTRDIFDMFFDPQQIGEERERQIRSTILEIYGKKLVRYIP